jgi:hypothetical protein
MMFPGDPQREVAQDSPATINNVTNYNIAQQFNGAGDPAVDDLGQAAQGVRPA